MKNLIVTNNDRLLSVEAMMERYFKVVLVDGNLKEVVEISRNYLMADYQLAADPLSCRRERPTPYLTIILEPKNVQKDNTARDILSVEKFNAMFNANEKILGQIPEDHKKDFGLIDYSLTLAICDKILSVLR